MRPHGRCAAGRYLDALTRAITTRLRLLVASEEAAEQISRALCRSAKELIKAMGPARRFELDTILTVPIVVATLAVLYPAPDLLPITLSFNQSWYLPRRTTALVPLVLISASWIVVVIGLVLVEVNILPRSQDPT